MHEDGGVSKVAEVEDTSKTLQDYIVKKRLYGRFRKAKDTCGYSESGVRKREKREKLYKRKKKERERR